MSSTLGWSAVKKNRGRPRGSFSPARERLALGVVVRLAELRGGRQCIMAGLPSHLSDARRAVADALGVPQATAPARDDHDEDAAVEHAARETALSLLPPEQAGLAAAVLAQAMRTERAHATPQSTLRRLRPLLPKIAARDANKAAALSRLDQETERAKHAYYDWQRRWRDAPILSISAGTVEMAHPGRRAIGFTPAKLCECEAEWWPHAHCEECRCAIMGDSPMARLDAWLRPIEQRWMCPDCWTNHLASPRVAR
jgi:hypothetical protein